MREERRPSLQRVTTSGEGSRLAVARPSLLGVASSWPVMSTMPTVVVVMVVIPVVTVEVGSEVRLVVPPPTVAEVERRETELPTSPSGGVHGSPT